MPMLVAQIVSTAAAARRRPRSSNTTVAAATDAADVAAASAAIAATPSVKRLIAREREVKSDQNDDLHQGGAGQGLLGVQEKNK